MEFSLTFWSWFGLISNLATMAVSLAIFLMMLGVARWQRANLWLWLFLVSLFGQVASGQTANTLLWLDRGDPLISFWISLLFYSANGVALFALAGNLIGLRDRAFHATLVTGAIAWLVAVFLLWRGVVVTDVWLNETGLLRFDITPLGYGLSMLPFVYQAAALGLMVYHLKRLEDNWVMLGVGMLMIGPLLTMFRLERFTGVPIPTTSLGTLAGISVVGYTVARRRIFDRLHQLTFELNHQVAEHTREVEQVGEDLRLANEALNRRTRQLQASIEVTRELASTLGLDQMLHRAVELVRDHLGYFHVALYLVDDRHEWAMLQASATEVPHLLEQMQHKVQVGSDTPVGHAIANGEPILRFAITALGSVGVAERSERDADDSSAGHSLLPGARSGLALPLKVEAQVIGALYLQSSQEAFLDEEEVSMLHTLADHLAIAIENARLLQRTRVQLDELTELYRHYSQQTWQKMPANLAVTYRQGEFQVGDIPLWGLRAGPESWEPEGARSWASGSAQAGSPDSPAGEGSRLEGDENLVTVPVNLRGETIGVLGFRKDETSADWSPSIKALVESVVSEMALALENARLFDEAQTRATREQALNEMVTRFARSIDIDTVLQTAVRELGQLPHVAEVSVHLGPPQELPLASGDANQD